MSTKHSDDLSDVTLDNLSLKSEIAAETVSTGFIADCSWRFGCEKMKKKGVLPKYRSTVHKNKKEMCDAKREMLGQTVPSTSNRPNNQPPGHGEMSFQARLQSHCELLLVPKQELQSKEADNREQLDKKEKEIKDLGEQQKKELAATNEQHKKELATMKLKAKSE